MIHDYRKITGRSSEDEHYISSIIASNPEHRHLSGEDFFPGDYQRFGDQWTRSEAETSGIYLSVETGHCSDGWDRTSQTCALAQLMLDPYYRTIQVRTIYNSSMS